MASDQRIALNPCTCITSSAPNLIKLEWNYALFEDLSDKIVLHSKTLGFNDIALTLLSETICGNQFYKAAHAEVTKWNGNIKKRKDWEQIWEQVHS